MKPYLDEIMSFDLIDQNGTMVDFLDVPKQPDVQLFLHLDVGFEGEAGINIFYCIVSTGAFRTKSVRFDEFQFEEFDPVVIFNFIDMYVRSCSDENEDICLNKLQKRLVWEYG